MIGEEEKNGKDKEGMTPEQLLYPDEIYALNRVLFELSPVKQLDPNCNGEAIISPTLFSKHSRTFHWMAVDKWKVSNYSEIRNLVNKIYDDDNGKAVLSKEWKAYTESMPKLEQYTKAVKEIQDITKDLLSSKKKKVDFGSDKLTSLHKYFLMLYEGYHHDKFLYIDGIIYRHLHLLHENAECHEGINYVKGLLKSEREEDRKKRETYWDYAWLQCDFIDFKDNNLFEREKWQCQEALLCCEEENSIEKPKKEALCHRPGFTIQDELLKLFFSPPTGLHHLLIKPLYDGWIGEKECGAIWGNLILLFEKENTRNAFVTTEKLKELKEVCYVIIHDLRDAALSSILSQPIIPPYDLIEHFVDHLRIFQNWERIIVFRREGKEHKPEYCYRWKEESGKSKWGRCPCNDSKQECSDCISWDAVSGDTGKYLCWNIDLWNEAYIPSISDEEKQRYGSFLLAFEYPITSVIPSDEEERKDLGELYIRQQLDVLRGLLRKVRARRSALRNAAVSIMGRNMSHNIGSHVLARYATSRKLTNDGEVKQFMRYLQERMDFIAEVSTTDVFYTLPTRFHDEAMMGLTGDPDKPRQKILLEYISGLKDVDVEFKKINKGGSDVTYDSPGGRLGMHALYVILENIARNTAKHGSSALKDKSICVEAVYTTNYLTLKFNLEKLPGENSEILLSYTKPDESSVPTMENLKVTVNGASNFIADSHPVSNMFSGKPWNLTNQSLEQDDNSITIQAGENTITVGLSNGVCNCNDFPKEAFTLTVQNKKQISLNIMFSEDHQWNDEFIEVRVWDNRGNCLSDDRKKWYPDWINNILKTPFITDSGEIEPQYWGIREIFLAAAYLRAIPLNDLESRSAWPNYDNGDTKDKKAPNILECVAVDNNGVVKTTPTRKKMCSSRLNLGYRFYLNKRRLLVEFHDNGDTWAHEDGVMSNTRLPSLGIKLLPIADDAKPMKHSYGIFPKNTYESLNDEVRLRLPVMWFGKGESYLQSFDVDKAEELLAQAWWRKHLKERIGYDGDDDPYAETLFCTGDCGASAALEYKQNFELHAILSDSDAEYKKLLIFEHHKQLEDGILDKFGFYEPFGSQNPQSILIHDESDDKKELYRTMFKTAALTRILLVDERIQAMQSKVANGVTLTYGELFPLMGIFVPSEADVDLDKVDQQNDEFFGWLKSVKDKATCRKNGKAYDFIIIHQGIIDKLRKVNEVFDGKFEKEAERLGCKGRIIVCSGRGDPRGGLPEYARFVSVSSILEWTINNPSKFHLVNLLSHSRRPG